MKRIISFVLVCALLLAGTVLSVQATESMPVKAGTIDDLLAAIRPGAVIELEAKDYVLPEATGYGKTAGEYWAWVDCYDGYELQIENVNDLTITAPEGTRLLTDPRYANVLLFRNCHNITVNGLTLGHTPEKGACCGGVVSLEACSGITLDSCVLFGCGVTALMTYDCDTIAVTNSALIDCSYSGAEIYRSEDVLFDQCTFSGNGEEEEYTGAALYVDASRYVSVMNCGFTENHLEHLLHAEASFDVTLAGCESYNNEFAFFWLEATDVTVINCGFAELNAGNVFAAAYNPGRVLDANGNQLSFDSLLLMKHIPVKARPERAQKAAATLVTGASNQHYYEVGTADELLAAIGSHRVICLTRDIDLSTATDYGTGYTDCWRWEHLYDGAELIIYNVKDLTLTAKQPGVTLVTSPRSANVLTFNDCKDITVSGLAAGHTEMPEYECSGAVLVFNECTDTEIEDCALFGCGTIGVEAFHCKEMEIEDTEIYDCTQGGIYLYNVDEAEIEHCSIHDCNGPALFIGDGCQNIEVDGKEYLPGDYRQI